MIPLRAFFSFPTRTTIEKTTQKHDKSDMDHMKTERINEIAATPRHEQDILHNFPLQNLESREMLVIKTHQETTTKVKKKTLAKRTTDLSRMKT